MSLIDGLLQLSLYGADLEYHPEATAGPECDDKSCDGHCLVHLCNTSAVWTALVSIKFPGTIQAASCYL